MKIFLTGFLLLSFLSIAFPQNYSWQLKQSGSSLGGPVDVERFNHNNVYYGSDNKVYKSTDRGETFTQMGINVPQAAEIKCILVDDSNPSTLIVGIEGTTDKVVKTTNSGASWTITADGLSFSYFGIPITQDPSHPDTLYMMNDTNFERSTDFGSTWTTISTNVGTNSAPCDIEVFPDTSIILVGDNGTGIFKSTDYGLTWSQTYSTSGEIPTITVDFQHQGIAWATKWSGGGGVLKSTNYGQTWSLVPYFGSINMWGIHVQESDGNIILANSYSTSPGSWRSTNAGASWTAINIPSPGYQVVSIDTMTQFAAQGGGFYKLNSPYFIPVELSSFTATVTNNEIILNWKTATELNNQGFDIEKSFDNQNFEKIGFVSGRGTTTEMSHYSFIIKDVSSKETFYRLKQIDFDGHFEYSNVVEANGIQVNNFSLEQNYPNPFNPGTRIDFTLPVESNVLISIYNLIGQKVMDLVNSKFEAGKHSIEFNAKNLSSGIYFYKIEAGNFSTIKKMQLLK